MREFDQEVLLSTRSGPLAALGLALLGVGCGAPSPPAQPPPPVMPLAPPPPASSAQPSAPAADAPPPARRGDDKDVLHGVTVLDPYRWLEDAKSPEVAAWMRAEDAFARRALGALPGRGAREARLAQLFYHDGITAPLKRGGRLFYTRRHADKEKAIVYVKAGDGPERVLFDPNTLSEDGSVSLRGWSPSRDGKLVAYSLSKNNSDAATLHLRDVDRGVDLPRDVIPGAKYAHPSWTPDGAGFFYTRLPTDPSIPPALLPGRAEVRFHRVGDDPASDALVHPATGDSSKFVGAHVSRDGRWLILELAHGWTSNDVWVRDLSKLGLPVGQPGAAFGAGFTPLVTGKDAHYDVTAHKGTLVVLTDEGAPRSRVFAVDPARLDRRHWREIVPEGPAKIDGLSIVGGRLALSLLVDAKSQLELRALSGKLERRVELPGPGTTSGMLGDPDDPEAYYSFSSYTDPPRVFRVDLARRTQETWATVTYPVDGATLAVTQVFYRSKDGTRVSMFVMHRRGAEKTGEAKTILYGYGGFNHSMTPWFSPAIVAWVEQGGVYAIPNLRGGGEYGEAWHRDGMLLKKQNVFDDFLAAARFLVDEGWTRPSRLAIQGGSNGGLLVGAAMTQSPASFGAVVCSVPLLDMLRFHRFGSGKTWVSEYGSAEDPRQFEALRAYSPLHNVVEGRAYPPLLMLSADSDDRVDPLHARKFVAEVRHATGRTSEVLLRIEQNAGHGGGDMVKKDVARTADVYSWLDAKLR